MWRLCQWQLFCLSGRPKQGVDTVINYPTDHELQTFFAPKSDARTFLRVSERVIIDGHLSSEKHWQYKVGERHNPVNGGWNLKSNHHKGNENVSDMQLYTGPCRSLIPRKPTWLARLLCHCLGLGRWGKSKDRSPCPRPLNLTVSGKVERIIITLESKHCSGAETQRSSSVRSKLGSKEPWAAIWTKPLCWYSAVPYLLSIHCN